MRAVVICHNPELGLVVLKSLRANGAQSLLVCSRCAHATLRASRLAEGTLMVGDPAPHPEAVADAINARHGITPIDIVMAADVQGLRLLHAIRHLAPPVYLMPDKETLDLLDDKWALYRFATRLGLDVPRTLFFSGRNDIDRRAIIREIGFPAVVKPVSQWASIGFRCVASERDLAKLVDDPAYNFDGTIVQQFVPGHDIGAGLFARSGIVQALSTFRCGPRNATEFVRIPVLAAIASKIAAETSYDGVANFDARMDDKGRVWLIECNPRFFMRITAARICGLDFLKLGLPGCSSASMPQAQGRYYSLVDLASTNGLRHALSGRWPAQVLFSTLREACTDPGPSIVRRVSHRKA
jgi:biotin carboxylase